MDFPLLAIGRSGMRVAFRILAACLLLIAVSGQFVRSAVAPSSATQAVAHNLNTAALSVKPVRFGGQCPQSANRAFEFKFHGKIILRYHVANIHNLWLRFDEDGSPVAGGAFTTWGKMVKWVKGPPLTIYFADELPALVSGKHSAQIRLWDTAGAANTLGTEVAVSNLAHFQVTCVTTQPLRPPPH